jgi:hypothetical protein
MMLLESCKVVPAWSQSINKDGHQKSGQNAPCIKFNHNCLCFNGTDGYKPSSTSAGRVFSMPKVEERYIISSFELDYAVDGIGTELTAAHQQHSGKKSTSQALTFLTLR